MPQSGQTPIQLYRSTTAAAAPVAGNLTDGELAINTTDEKLYFKNAGGSVKLLASTAATALPAAGIATSTGTAWGTSITTSAGLAAALSDETGSGAAVFATSPTLVTPILGVATATSLQAIIGNVTPAAATATALKSTVSTEFATEALALTTNNLPTIRPTLNLDFANAQVVDPRITFTRASTATRTNSKGLIETVASGTPRIDYDAVTGACKGLLIEESRTNLLTYSEQFDNAAWMKTRASVTANATTAPDGTLTADKLVEAVGTATDYHIAQGTSVIAGTSYTLSVYAKAGTRTQISLWLQAGGFGVTQTGVFDLSNGTSASEGGTATLAITPVGVGWYRCSITATATATVGSNQLIRLANAGSSYYTGDGTSGLYIWGAQLEAGAFATSYIPTVASQVTRAADVASMTGTNFSSWYRQDEGSFVSEGSRLVTGASASNPGCLWGVASGAFANSVYLANDSGKLMFTVYVFVGGTNQVQFQGSAVATSQIKNAFVYKTNDFAASENGGAAQIDTSGALPSVPTTFSIGSTPWDNTSWLNGHISRLAFYPKRLTNVELQALSTQ